ncbi:site-specific integrase [Nocardia sp. NPDC049737]|uniref:tyrosine-type recombinase/integrase n=1 Tax=Nocardia sp. NPDC049737 TaxID=3154358 RepID=UPI0034257E03
MSVHRDVLTIVPPRWGRVRPRPGEVVPFVVVDDAGAEVEPISLFLREFMACGNRSSSARSYCYALLRWWRFLIAVGVEWNRATPEEGRDYVLWLLHSAKPIAGHRRSSERMAGRTNSVTRKPYPGDTYSPRTIRHANAVVHGLYEFSIDRASGPLVNPIPLRHGDRRTAHENPMRPYLSQQRLRYNPKVPKQMPRAMPDREWDRFFGALRFDRDRAIVALAISTAARAGELLGLRVCDIDWGDQLIRVRRKGTQAEQWLAASTDAFVWLRLYLSELGELGPDDALWWTVRRYRRASPPARALLNYDALRAVFRRANAVLGTNWSMHDARHTCAIRMTRDGNLSLRDVQTVLGHAHLSTTEIYLVEDDDAVISRVREHHHTQRQPPTPPPTNRSPAAGYDPAVMDILFGNRGGRR